MGVSPEIDGSILGSCMDTLRGTIPDVRSILLGPKHVVHDLNDLSVDALSSI